MKSMGGTVFVAAALIFAASAVAFGAAVVDAVRVEEVAAIPDPESATGADAGEGRLAPRQQEALPGAVVSVGTDPVAAAPQGSLRGMIYPQVTGNEILGAVNQDLFQPDRTPSIDRYLLPSERVAPETTSRNDRRSREPNLRIVGTAIAGDLALALVQPDDSIPFAVLLGETVDGFTLADVAEESVTLVRGDEEFTFPVVEPRRGSSSNNRDRNARNRNVTEDQARALTERVQQMLQGMQRGQMGRGGGVTSDVPVFQIPRVIELPPGVQVPRGRRPGGGGGGGAS